MSSKIKFCFLLITGLAIIIAGCKKPDKSKPCVYSYNDGSYTQTDTNGNIIGTADASDWNCDSTWNSCETALFNFSDTFNYQSATLSAVGTPAVNVYPNPFKTSFNLTTGVNGMGAFKAVIVDSKLNTLSTFQYWVQGHLATAINVPSADTATQYRMYYEFLGANKTVICKGHGDLRKTN